MFWFLSCCYDLAIHIWFFPSFTWSHFNPSRWPNYFNMQLDNIHIPIVFLSKNLIKSKVISEFIGFTLGRFTFQKEEYKCQILWKEMMQWNFGWSFFERPRKMLLAIMLNLEVQCCASGYFSKDDAILGNLSSTSIIFHSTFGCVQSRYRIYSSPWQGEMPHI